MKKYSVKVTKWSPISCTVEVWAEDEKAAFLLGQEKAENTESGDWDYSRNWDEETEVAVTEVPVKEGEAPPED